MNSEVYQNIKWNGTTQGSLIYMNTKQPSISHILGKKLQNNMAPG